jgi:hypothetical protein
MRILTLGMAVCFLFAVSQQVEDLAVASPATVSRWYATQFNLHAVLQNDAS